jgi:hypothetical protein
MHIKSVKNIDIVILITRIRITKETEGLYKSLIG